MYFLRQQAVPKICLECLKGVHKSKDQPGVLIQSSSLPQSEGSKKQANNCSGLVFELLPQGESLYEDECAPIGLSHEELVAHGHHQCGYIDHSKNGVDEKGNFAKQSHTCDVSVPH